MILRKKQWDFLLYPVLVLSMHWLQCLTSAYMATKIVAEKRDRDQHQVLNNIIEDVPLNVFISLEFKILLTSRKWNLNLSLEMNLSYFIIENLDIFMCILGYELLIFWVNFLVLFSWFLWLKIIFMIIVCNISYLYFWGSEH